MEHRLGRRVPTNLDVHLTCRPYAVGAGRMTNASMSGAFVKTRLEPAALSRLILGVDVPQPWGAKVHHELLAYVVRHGTDGLGIEWCEFASRAVTRLLHYSVGQQSDEITSFALLLPTIAQR